MTTCSIPHGWEMRSLDELCDFQNGYSFLNKEYENNGNLNNCYLVFRMGNIARGGGLNPEASPVFVRRDKSRDLTRFVLKTNDLAMCMTDMKASMALLGHTARIDKNNVFIQNQRVGRITVRETDVLDPIYLYYYTNSKEYIEHLRSVANSGVQVNLSTAEIKKSPIIYPPLPTQHKIAAILSAYDDLIENNTRRIKILEEMAQSLYREWFVHFRFPGHEGVRLVESELGLVPEGWEVVPFTRIADVLSGGTPSTVVPAYWNGDIPFFTPKDIAASFYVLDTERKITDQGLRRCSSELYPKDTVFITARGTVGKVILPSKPMAMSQTSYALRGRDNIGQYFVFLAISDAVAELKQRSHGAVFDTIIVDTFRRLETILPPQSMIGSFNDLVAPLFGQVLNLQQKNANLRRTRDLLLPKLISGEIDVEVPAMATATER
jgi:type I restriction enzyme S subunit